MLTGDGRRAHRSSSTARALRPSIGLIFWGCPADGFVLLVVLLVLIGVADASRQMRTFG